MRPEAGDATDGQANDGQAVRDLLDRDAIRDCLHRYCRGIDRGDMAALRGSYWPDAIDRHGAYQGPVEGFFGQAERLFATDARNVHQVSNILVTFVSAAPAGHRRAAVETYFNALQRGGGRQFHLAGRYCDLFEKRDGEWRVAERTVVYDWVDEQTPPDRPEAERFGARQPAGANFPHDPVYALLARG